MRDFTGTTWISYRAYRTEVAPTIARIVLLLWAVLASSASASGISISGEFIVYEGRSLSLYCFLGNTSLNATSIQWYKNMELSDNNGPYFNKTNSTREDQGTYFCRSGNLTSVNHSLEILWIEKPIVNGSKQLKEGAQLTLACLAEGNPSISSYQWLKDIVPQNSTRQTLEIESVSRNDTGRFACRVSNGVLNETSPPVYLNITWMDKPNIKGNVTIKEGENLVLSCSSNANPAPTSYTWTKDGTSITEGNGTRVQGDTKTSIQGNAGGNANEIVIQNITKNDTGSYSCEVSNGLETKVSEPFNVDVYYLTKPAIAGELVVGETQTLQLQCRVEGNPANISFSWFRNRIKLNNETQNTFSVQSSNRTDSGNFSCTAENIFGKRSSESVEVRIEWNDKPYIESSVDTFEVKENSSVSLECKVVSSHTGSVLYRWYKNNQSILGENSRLYNFTIVNRNATGFYSCQTIYAQANATEMSERVYLNVTWLDASYVQGNETVKENETLTLICEASGNPTPNIYWFKDDDLLLSTNTTYQKTSHRNDDGSYTCNATNSFGSRTSEAFDVDVFWLDKPVVSGKETVNTSESIELTCNVSGNPTPTAFQWLKHGVLQTSSIERTRTYKLSNVNRDNIGNYSCNATNSFGTKSSQALSVDVLWIEIPSITIKDGTIKDGQVAVNESSTLSLNCNPTGNPPRFRYQWRKERGPIKTYSNVYTKTWQRGDKGNYACAVTSDAGYQESNSIDVDVWWLNKPKINGSRSIEVGKSLKLTCSSEGNPPTLQYRWYRPNKDVYTNRILNIDDVTLVHAGNYTCEVQSPFGSKMSSTFKIEITPKKEVEGNAALVAAVAVGFISIIILLLVLLYFIVRKRRYESLGDGILLRPMVKTSKANFNAIQHEAPVPKENFKAHLNALRANSGFLFSQQYAIITDIPEPLHEHSLTEENFAKNRYANVSACDKTRVILSTVGGDPSSDYINANYICGYDRGREYIAAQGPLPDTVYDFWRMVWEQDSTTIVMLTNVEEGGRIKCEKYWPDSGFVCLNDIVVAILDTQIYPDCIIRTFTVKRSEQRDEEGLTVKQFHYTVWPDFGVPNDPCSVLSFMKNIWKWTENSETPVVVHCSAGVGRTGTYITIESQIKKLKEKNELTIFNNVRDLRHQRNLMVQTEVQYVFVHDAILEYLRSGETEVPARQLRDYIKSKSAVDNESGCNGFFQEFVHLSKQQQPQYTFTEASKDANACKNLYKNVLPYDQTRVKLSPIAGTECSDYINASYVSSYATKKHFIACQAPLQKTVEDFWRMVWETKCGVIVNICENIEKKKQTLLSQYWPNDSDDAVTFGSMVVRLVSQTTENGYVDRELSIHNSQTKETRSARMFQITSWSDNEMTSLAAMLISIIGHVQKYNSTIDNHPVTVHCSAGVGRTGVFIALSNLIEQAKSQSVVDIYLMVKVMRQQRTAMVHTKDQYEFLYNAVQEYLESFDLFSNDNQSFDNDEEEDEEEDE